MKNNIKEITILIIILMIVIIAWIWYKKYENEKIFQVKFEMQKEEIEKNKISADERKIIDMKREKEKKSKELKDVKTYQDELQVIEKDLISDEECLKIQIQRVFEQKEVVDWYCDLEKSLKQDETPKTELVSDSIQKEVQTYSKSNFKITKSSLFTCLDIKNKYSLKVDENRCATMMTLVWFLETQYWTTWIWPKLNNMYWIKNPTDKKWLLWNWEKVEANNIKFDTKELSSYAFAYYYMNYHNHRSFENFVNRYVAWNNLWYINALENNYDWIYSEYETILK